jgi:3,4-dihydroxy 2-butanone 4-phosphate synthase / GTP cyclohydrolase II
MAEFFSTEEILKDFQQGKFVILVDDEDRENEGDLIIAAEFVRPEHVNFMAIHGRGLICLAMTSQQINQLRLPMMISREHKSAKLDTAFTYTIEASAGVTTGISAADRAHTISVAIQKDAQPSDVVCPGHIFPLKANDNGVLGRMGHTEAAVDLAKLSQLNPSAVICEIINMDGTMSRVVDLIKFSRDHQIKIGTIKNLIEYRKQNSL